MKKLVVLALCICAAFGLKAQVSPDYPLYFSQYSLNGTANYISRAGAIGAVGGDIMSAHFNPAGLGLYKKSEITFSTGLDFNFTDSKLAGINSKDDRTSFNFGNLGLVGTLKSGSKGLKYIQIAIGINNLRNFNNRMTMTRNGMTSSFINDVVMDDIVNTQNAEHDFITSGIVDLDSNGVISSIYESGTFDQIKSIEQTGYLSEFSISLSGNIEDKFYVGATLGFPFAYYKATEQFVETRFSDAGDNNGYYTYTTISELNASGVNLKLGAIYKPWQFLRLGAAIHTPTYYMIEDNYYSEVLYNRGAGSVAPLYEYDIQTPFRALGSIALVFGNNSSPIGGTISADYEYANYSSMSYGFENDIYYEREINRQIENLFRAGNTLRLGGELKLGMIALRAGYANMSNPYNEPNDAALNCISAGVGYKGKNYSFDIAYSNISGNQNYQMYDGAIANISKSNNLIQLTFGARF